MVFKSSNQRKAFFARVRPLPNNLINPYFIPKGSRFAVTKARGIKAYTGKVRYFKSKARAVSTAKKTKTPIFKIPAGYRKV